MRKVYEITQAGKQALHSSQDFLKKQASKYDVAEEG